MNKEERVVGTAEGKTCTTPINSSLANCMQVQCVLHGTDLCPHPQTCSGYDDRKCDNWRRHSGK